MNCSQMTDDEAAKAKGRRAILLLYLLMAAGVALPLVYFWRHR